MSNKVVIIEGATMVARRKGGSNGELLPVGQAFLLYVQISPILRLGSSSRGD